MRARGSSLALEDSRTPSRWNDVRATRELSQRTARPKPPPRTTMKMNGVVSRSGGHHREPCQRGRSTPEVGGREAGGRETSPVLRASRPRRPIPDRLGVGLGATPSTTRTWVRNVGAPSRVTGCRSQGSAGESWGSTESRRSAAVTSEARVGAPQGLAAAWSLAAGVISAPMKQGAEESRSPQHEDGRGGSRLRPSAAPCPSRTQLRPPSSRRNRGHDRAHRASTLCARLTAGRVLQCRRRSRRERFQFRGECGGGLGEYEIATQRCRHEQA